MTITVTISDQAHLAGIGAAAVAAGAASSQDYFQQVCESAAMSYRDQFAVDRITSSAFVFRFTQTEYVAIKSAAVTDQAIAGFLAELDAAPYVWLAAQQVKAGMDYLVAQGLLTQTRQNEILSYPIPEPTP